MKKKRTVKATTPARRKRLSIVPVKPEKIKLEAVYAGSIDLEEYKQSNREDRETLIERSTNQAYAGDLEYTGKLGQLLDKTKRHTPITIDSITPDAARSGDTVKVVVEGAGFNPDGCTVFFSTPSGGQQGTIIGTRDIGGSQTEWSVTVPDFPGASGPIMLDVYIRHETWYTLPSPAVGTPPLKFSVVDAVSNTVSFRWLPNVPVIELFLANGHAGTSTVEPGTNVELSWRVRNVTEIKVERSGTAGPVPSIDDVFTSLQGSVETWRRIGPFQGNSPREETYTLTAFNSQGGASASVCVRLRKRPFLRILGVEMVQSMQHFSLDPTVTLPGGAVVPSAVYNNSVGLIERKKTIARIYVESGMSGGFQNGAGADEQPNVLGKVTLTLGNGSKRTITTIRNAAGTVVARRKALLDRNDFENTLNIELPTDCLTGQVKLDARVWVDSDMDGVNHSGDPSGSGYAFAKSAGYFTFAPKRHLQLVEIRVRDDHLGLSAPSDADYWESVEGLLARYPIAHDGVDVFLPTATGDEIYETTRDLTLFHCWLDLIDDIEEISDQYANQGQYWTAVVPDDPAYFPQINGVSERGGYLDLDPHPCLLARARLRATFAHELTHNLGFGHSPCWNPNGNPPGQLDPNLPAHTDELGLDVALGELIPKGTGDLMSYCWHYDPQTRWPSLFLWQKLCTILAP